MNRTSKAPLLVILGETATGKSRLALELAKRLEGEIICADSWTVRKELNIGTDKPSIIDRSEIKHHLIDVVAPDEHFSAVVFKDMANKAIADIHSRGKLPIIAGGTGLYIDSVIFDYGFLEDSEPDKRDYLNSLTIEELQNEIKIQKLPISDSIDQRNKRRLIRLIESTGKEPKKSSLRTNTLLIGLKMKPDDQLVGIKQRVNEMINNGLEGEVKMLSDKYGWGCEALKGVGYKQWQRYFEGTQGLEETKQQIVSATNNLAKKQRTWFKRNKSIHWKTQPIKIDEVVELVTTHLSI
jgi:tRNA dimethylallyltransferase